MGSKIGQKYFLELRLVDLVFDLVIGWSQDGSKTVPRGLLGGSWVVLGPSWEGLGPLLGALGPFLDGLGGGWGRLEGSWSRFGVVLNRFGVRFVDSMHRLDLLMRFVDSIY